MKWCKFINFWNSYCEWIQKPFVKYSLSIYSSSSTGERESTEYITEDEKDQFDIQGVPKVRSSTL